MPLHLLVYAERTICRPNLAQGFPASRGSFPAVCWREKRDLCHESRMALICRRPQSWTALLTRMLLALFADRNLSPLRLAHLFTPGGVSSEAWDRVSMIAPVKKYGRARLSTGLWKTSNEQDAFVLKFCKRHVFHVQTIKKTFQLSLHLNLGHFEASGINVPA